MISKKEMNMNIAQLFDDLSFKFKDQFFLDKNSAEEDKLYASFNTNKSSPVNTRGFLTDRV